MPGLVLTAAAALLLANLADLTAISGMGSAGFLVIFAFVNAANFARHEEAKSSRWIAGLGVLACVGALVALLVHTYQDEPKQIGVLVGLVVLGFVIEAIYMKLRGPVA